MGQTITELPAPTFPAEVTLKSIRIHHGLSQETYAYTATVYLAGKRVGTVENDGHGGPDLLRVEDATAREAVQAAQRAYYPGQYGEDVLFGDMLTEHLHQKEAAKTLRKGYAFAVMAGDYVYGFNDRANIAPAMHKNGHGEYRVFEA